MTVVNINLKNVGSSTSPIDSVTFYSPVYRDGITTSELVSTAEHHVPLVDGVASVDLIPGPVRVHFKVRGIADTVAKDGTVPDSGPVSLNAVLQDSLNYTPGVINSALAEVEAALANALNEVEQAVATEIGGRVDDIKRGNADMWLTATHIPTYETLPTGNYKATSDFLRQIGIDGAYAGRFVRTYTSGGGNFTDRVEYVAGGVPYVFYQTKTSAGLSGWKRGDADAQGKITALETDIAAQADISAARQEAVRERLVQSRGGRVGTSGKGVVALRFDHGVPAFTEHILPMLQARGLSASQCHYIEDPEADWSQANLNFGSGIEVYSHSWTHRDTTSDAEIHKEIVESRQELERLVPNALVAGWMTPGAGAEAYDGWWAATGVEERAPFYAQQLIDSTYGSADTAPSVWNPLGTRHWGHRSIDRDSSFSQYQSLIDQAADTRTGVVLMVHPSFIRDNESYIDFSEFEQVLDYIVQMRDAGRIEVLTATGMTLADSNTGYRDNMLHGDLSIWTGWGSGSTRSGTPASGELRHYVALANVGHVKGHVREFTIDASGAGTLQIRIYDSNTTLLDITRTVQVTDVQKIRIPVGIPLGGSRIWFTITCSSGSVAVTNPKLQAI